MLDTGSPQVDVDSDFLRARRRQVLARLSRWLRGQPGDGDYLLTLNEAVGPLGWRVERQLGLQTIRLDTIVGTVDPRRDFDRHFRPTSNWDRSRWEQLALAERRGAAIPPIEVYRVGGLYFVSDGHHRVSIAAAAGQRAIDACVTEVSAIVPPRQQPEPQLRPVRLGVPGSGADVAVEAAGGVVADLDDTGPAALSVLGADFRLAASDWPGSRHRLDM
jgi:hypothetical protein